MLAHAHMHTCTHAHMHTDTLTRKSFAKVGYNDFGHFNDKKTITPTIDGLLEQGIFLSDYYTFKICSPSRAAMLTGRWACCGTAQRAQLWIEWPCDRVTVWLCERPHRARKQVSLGRGVLLHGF